ncbi:MAG: flavodoxin family protein [Christensenellaceae bacterium]|jgi:multimeric flavodoxin WrbA|nr:flavodoxin family protein [Christensenellaceae bacterium]
MNVLVINGSPKGENSGTLLLTRAFLRGAGWADAEFISVAQSEIKPCRGCFACWNKTPGACAIRDDMAEILKKIIMADVIVWSFPLYYFSVPGELKTLIDRQLPLNLPFMEANSASGGHPSRYDMRRQRHVVISTCGFWTAKGNYDGVTALFDHFCGAGAYTKVFCGQGELFHIPELKARTEAYLEAVCRAGAEFASGGVTPQTQAVLAEPLYPQAAFERMADASWGIAQDGPAEADDSLSFTTQMAALYVPDGVERTLEMCYTDIGKTYQLILTKQGAKVVDKDFMPYSTKIETPYSVWRAIARGEIAGQDALFEHRYKVLGDFELMLRWDELFGAASPPPTETTGGQAPRKTNMALLLAPWMAVWIAMAIHATVGGAACIAVAAVLPLLWLLYKPTFYERISVPIVAGLSLAAMLGVDVRLVVPLSYGLFGLIWFAGAFAKIPLTAHYSANGYGGARAFGNPLFLRTNRILTAIWGALYLITPIWTYFLMGTALAAYIGLINSVIPAAMGAFTYWFQKWYPKKWAVG